MALAGDHLAVLVGGYALTADSHTMSITDECAQFDVTSFGDQVHNFVNGARNIKLEHKGFLNPAAARSHPVLKGAAVQDVVSVLVGQNADPVVGDPMFSLDVVQGQYHTLPEFNNAIPFMAQFAGRGQRGGWGQVLAAPQNITDSTTSSVIDQGASSPQGGAAFLHILTATASDTYSLVLEGSDTGAFAGEESTLATFSQDGSALGAERVALSGAIPRYVRWVATRSGSAGETLRLAINLVRF